MHGNVVGRCLDRAPSVAGRPVSTETLGCAAPAVGCSPLPRDHYRDSASPALLEPAESIERALPTIGKCDVPQMTGVVRVGATFDSGMVEPSSVGAPSPREYGEPASPGHR